MNRSNAGRIPAISHEKIHGLLAMRESLAAIKRRYEMLEDSVKATEAELIEGIESGCAFPPGIDLQIRTIERRYPHWKAAYAAVAAQVPGAKSVDVVLSETLPTLCKSLIVK